MVLLLVDQNKKIPILEARIAELERRLGMNSGNSSKPPSSDPPGNNPKRKGKRKSKRKRGAQKGHKGHHRSLVPEDQVSNLESVAPEFCAHCGGTHLEIDFTNPWRHQVWDLPQIKPLINEWRMGEGICMDCGLSTRADLPAGVPTGQFGPNLEALVAYLSGACHQSKRFIQAMLEDVFGVEMCLGSVSKCEKNISEALANSVEEAKQAVQQADLAHADETGWREENKKAWLWVMLTSCLTVFMIDRSRKQESAKRLLGGFLGILVCDRYGAYNIHMGLRQFCWAHLLRKFVGFSELKGKAGRIGDQLVDKTLLMFKWWHRIRDGTLKRRTFQRRMIKLRIEIEDLLIEGEVYGHEHMAGTCKRIIEQSEYLWTFVDHEDVPPTNNAAERAIRRAVLWRKGCFGTQSKTGSRFVERILTVAATCRQQGRGILEFLVHSRQAHLDGSSTPSLLAAQTT